MRKRYLIGTALVLSTAAGGVAAAAVGFGLLASQRHAERSVASETADPLGRPVVLAGETRERDHHADHYAEHHQRRHHQDDDNDDDEDGERSGRGTVPQGGPTEPNTPVPDNGLFKGRGRPKVQVQ